MLSGKIKDYLNEYISQEIYVQVSVAKGKNKITTNVAICKYFESNHFKELSEGRPYNTFLSDLKDKCLGKLINSPSDTCIETTSAGILSPIIVTQFV